MIARSPGSSRSIGRTWRAPLVGLLVWLASTGTASGAQLAPAGASVDVVKVTGVLDPSEAAYLRGTIEASELVDGTVVLQVDSLGSFGEQGPALARFLRAATVPVIAWVGPAAARAEGGALYLVYGSSLAAIAPGAGIGPGPPFDLATTAGREPAVEVQTATRALEDLAPGAGATPAGVRATIAGALPALPAKNAGAVAVIARDIPSLLRELDGRTVTVGDRTRVLATLTSSERRVDVRFHEIGPVRRTLHAVSTPTAVYVLLVLGLWGIAFELTQQGVGLAGMGGALALALAVYGLTVVPVHWLGFALIPVGILLQGADVFIRRLGPLTIIGTTSFLAGSLLAWWGVAPAVDLSLWLPILFTVSGLLLFGFGFTVAVQARERVRSQQVALVGLTGEARSDIDPEGGVVVKGAVWRARSADGKIPKGTRVRVRGIDGLVLRVEPEDDPD